MGRGTCFGREDAGGLNDVVSALGAPGDGGGVTFLEDRDGLAVDDEASVLGRDLALEAAVRRVVFEHIDHVLEIDEWVVNGDDLDRALFSQSNGVSENDPADSAKTVDSDFSDHFDSEV